MKQVFLDTKNVLAFRDAMSALEDVEKGQPGLALTYGRAGRGKTLCAREYAVRTGAVYLRVMQDWTPRGMLSRLCLELNGVEPRMTDRCKLMACEELDKSPRTVLVDEADRLNVSLIEHLRDIHDMSGAPIVLIGEEHLHAMLSSRGRLWSRVTQTVEFGPVVVDDILMFALKAADIKLDADAARLIGKRSSGDFRLVWLDVNDLERMARAGKTREVDRRMVEALPKRKLGPSARQ
jgi:DNA transposition AAA+ family ATPase